MAVAPGVLAGGSRRRAPGAGRRGVRETLFALLLLAPSIAVFAVFVFYPLVKTFYLGLYRSDPFGLSQQHVGFDQYRDVLASSEFRESLWTTGLFALYTVPTGLVLGLLLALLAHQKLRGIVVFRTIFSSTIASSVSVAAVIWLTLLNPSIGIINYGLREAGAEPVAWLNDPDWALLAVSLTTVWLNLGFTFIVMLAGLQAIPEELHESAKIDGAGSVSRFFGVTLPLLSPTIFFAFLVLVIFAFQSFGQIDILTQGGPLDSTNVIVYSIYTEGFRNFNEGVAAAQAVVLFLIVLALTLLQFRFLERRVFYGR
ncbi:MAG: ABC transporter permease subunit [Dehalococcoidia bacterium]|nr:ABC transporter permease subunit [Dehalococcoidia bacterium]